MTAKLEFFYDYVSPYTYLANSQLAGLGAEIRYRPMLLGGVLKATGNRPPRSVPAKGAYLTSDLRRWAALYGIPFDWPASFPQNTVTALRVAIVAERAGCLGAIHQPMFDAAWRDGRDLGDAAVLADILGAAGLDAEGMLAAAAADDVKAELRANSDEAVERGVFGAPTFFVGDEMFFGNDRFPFIVSALASAG